MPYALKSNIHYIGLAVPQTINESIIFITHRKLLRVPLMRLGHRVCSLSYPLSSNVHRLSIAAYSSSPMWPINYSARKTTMKYATLIIDDNTDGNVCSSLNPFPIGRTPNTANAQTNTISVSHCCIVWFNNLIQNSNTANCTIFIPLGTVSRLLPFSIVVSWSVSNSSSLLSLLSLLLSSPVSLLATSY
jgi:hypothetical protein